MGPDNAVHAGPWRLLNWPRQTPLAGWAQDIRVAHASTDAMAIELVDGPWSCAKYEFREDGLWLDLTLVHVESGRAVAGTFDMEDGVWAPSDGSGQMTVAEFHRAHAGNSTTIAIWPADPFKDVHAPVELSVRSPDGQFFIDLTTNQWRLSDWICPPRIVHIPTSECLLDLKTTNWDGRANFARNGMAHLRLRQYPAVADSLALELDLAGERYRVVEGGREGLPPEGYLDELQKALGRSAQDLDDLGVTIDVRPSRREGARTTPASTGGRTTDRAGLGERSVLDEQMERRIELEDFEPVKLAPMPATPVTPARVAPAARIAPVTPARDAPDRAAPQRPAPERPAPTVGPEPAAPRVRPSSPTVAGHEESFTIPPPGEGPSAFTMPPAQAPQPRRERPVEPERRPEPSEPRQAAESRPESPAEPGVESPAEPRSALRSERAPEPAPIPPRARPAPDLTSALEEMAMSSPAGVASIRSTIEAIEAEVTRQRLNSALHYEMIVLGVIRAAASGITRPEDAVSILQTLAARRGDIGPRA